MTLLWPTQFSVSARGPQVLSLVPTFALASCGQPEASATARGPIDPARPFLLDRRDRDSRRDRNNVGSLTASSWLASSPRFERAGGRHAGKFALDVDLGRLVTQADIMSLA